MKPANKINYNEILRKKNTKRGGKYEEEKKGCWQRKQKGKKKEPLE